jgi:hypothetical protein
MVKLVVALALAGAASAAVFLAPIFGRTVADRWSAAPDAATFARNAWDEAAAAASGDARAPAPRPSSLPVAGASRKDAGRDAARGAPRKARPLPEEHHTPEDRAALDRLLSERSR